MPAPVTHFCGMWDDVRSWPSFSFRSYWWREQWPLNLWAPLGSADIGSKIPQLTVDKRCLQSPYISPCMHIFCPCAASCITVKLFQEPKWMCRTSNSLPGMIIPEWWPLRRFLSYLYTSWMRHWWICCIRNCIKGCTIFFFVKQTNGYQNLFNALILIFVDKLLSSS